MVPLSLFSVKWLGLVEDAEGKSQRRHESIVQTAVVFVSSGPSDAGNTQA